MHGSGANGLLDAVGAENAVIAGHDWGAPVAWHCALLRPDRFRAVIGLSILLFGAGLVGLVLLARRRSNSHFVA